DLGEIVLAVVKLLDEIFVARRLFQRIEIGTLHVLDDRDLERFLVADLEQRDRNVMHARALRRAPAPLAGDDLVLVFLAADRTDEDRLENALLADRRGKIVELLGVENLARVFWIGL